MQPAPDPYGLMTGMYPSDAAIAAIEAQFQAVQNEYHTSDDRLDEIRRAAGRLGDTYQGPDLDVAHRRLEHETENQKIVVENARKTTEFHEPTISMLRSAQIALNNIVNHYTPMIDELLKESQQQAAAVAYASGKAEVAEYISEKSAEAEAENARMLAANRQPKPFDSGGNSSGGHDSGHIKPTKYTQGPPTESDSGGERPGSGRVGGNHEQTGNEDAEEKDSKNTKNQHGRSTGTADQQPSHEPDSVAGNSQPGRLGASAGQGLTPSSGGQGALSGLPSPSSMGGSGGGGNPLSAGSGLTQGLGSGFKPPTSALEGSGLTSGFGKSLTSPSLPASGAGGGSGAGSSSGATGGGSMPRFLAPTAPLTSIQPAAPVAEPSGAMASGNPLTPPPAQTHTMAPGAMAGGGAMMGGAGGVGATAAAPASPPAQVGAAPTPSPGLSQSPVGPAGAAGAGSGAGPGGAMSVVPTAMSETGPATRNQYAELAVNAVQVLAPAMVAQEALTVAAAVVLVPGGIPQVVITTNDGAGFLPAGCYLPPTMTHAFVDLADQEFDAKWFGWSDPARTLLAYAAARSDAVDANVEVLGLASSAAVSMETKNLYPLVVPSVTPPQGAIALGEDKGRNAHRLKVLMPDFYSDVQLLSATERNRTAVNATGATMASAAAVSLTEPGGAWHVYCASGGFTDQQWQQFSEQYENDRRGYGMFRPGFMESARPGDVPEAYREGFGKVRACETLLPWRDPGSMVLEDLLYTALLCGADLSGVFT